MFQNFTFKIIEKKLSVQDCDIMNTFNGIRFMSLDRGMYLKIQCLLNLLEEKLPLIDKTIVMHQDEMIWSGLEQEDAALIYNYLKELVELNAKSPNTQSQPSHMAKFLIHENIQNKLDSSSPTTSSNQDKPDEKEQEYFELEKVYIGTPLEKFYIIPYNLNKLTFFIFIQCNREFKLSLLKTIDEVLGSHMLSFLQDINDQQMNRRSLTKLDLISLSFKIRFSLLFFFSQIVKKKKKFVISILIA